MWTHAGRNYRSGAAVLQTQGHLSPPTNLLYAEMGISSLQQVTRNPEGTEITGEPPEAFPGGDTTPQDPTPSPGEMASLGEGSPCRGGEDPSSPNCPGRTSRSRSLDPDKRSRQEGLQHREGSLQESPVPQNFPRGQEHPASERL